MAASKEDERGFALAQRRIDGMPEKPGLELLDEKGQAFAFI
jgi:hypothetical protein